MTTKSGTLERFVIPDYGPGSMHLVEDSWHFDFVTRFALTKSGRFQSFLLDFFRPRRICLGRKSMDPDLRQDDRNEMSFPVFSILSSRAVRQDSGLINLDPG
jgi:hypothetical protein